MNDSDDDGPIPVPAIGDDARLAVGIGCTSRASASEIIALVDQALAGIGASGTNLGAVISHTRKAGSAVLLQVAQHFGVELWLLGATELARGVPSPSLRVEQLIGLPSVAEAAAAVAGPLLVRKSKSANATCAIAIFAQEPGPATYAANAATASSSVATSIAGP